MKLHRVHCDACGAVIPPERVGGVVVVPKANARPSLGFPFLPTEDPHDYYDICRSCVEAWLGGLAFMQARLRARFQAEGGHSEVGR